MRTTGLVLGVVGVALLVTGATLALVGDSLDGDSQERNSRYVSYNAPVLLGAGLFLTGAILTPIGFVRYGSRSPGVSVEPL